MSHIHMLEYIVSGIGEFFKKSGAEELYLKLQFYVMFKTVPYYGDFTQITELFESKISSRCRNCGKKYAKLSTSATKLHKFCYRGDVN